MPPLINTLREQRTARGLTREGLARRVGVSRQSYSAIEDGKAAPSTTIALHLARALGTSVEALFQLADEAETLEVELVGPPVALPARVRLASVGGRLLARAGTATRGFGRADGVARRGSGGAVSVRLLGGSVPQPLVALGCDPALALLADTLHAERGVELLWSEAGSRAALEGLARGEAHVAGVHLFDEATGSYNAPWVERLVPFPCTRIGFAVWEQGVMVPRGNPRGVRGVEDLARVRFVDREPGSGTRALVDAHLRRAGIAPGAVFGDHGAVARGHLAVGEAVASGLADAGVGVRAAANAFGLDLVPLAEERYDLVIPDHFLDLPAMQILLGHLRAPSLRAQVEALGGYDVAPMGVPA
jgi:molybdate-binding protein/DNA-binding XRE family transcriptional regulator